ncbi:MAG: Hydrolase [Rhodoglobus sp.]|nr:Hydrolase [Rhodoglobus sp.]
MTGLVSRIELRWSVVTPTLPAAVLWDMDGTLVNTEPYWISAETELIESFGGSWTHEEALQLVGSGLFQSATIIKAKGVDLPEGEIIDILTDRVLAQLVEFGIPWRPGARELLTELREQGIPTALVTMSIGRMAHHVADRLGFVGFDAVVSGDDVANSKPHPESYLRGAELLGVSPADCVAIEDSEPGIRSAAAAGAVVIGVPFMVDLPDDVAHVLWPTLAGRTLADLAGVLSAVAAR